MKNLVLLLLPALFFSCLAQEEGYKYSKRETSSLSNPLEADDDHNDPGGLPQSAQLSIASDPAVKSEIYDQKVFPVTVSAAPNFSGGSVNLSVDLSSLQADPIDAGDEIEFIFSENPVTLGPGEQKQVMVEMKSSSMVPSFKGTSEGGTGSVKIIAFTNSERTEFTKSVGVDAILTLKFVSPGVFRVGNDVTIPNGTAIPVRPHEGGVELKSFYAQDFGQAYIDATDDPGPCMHLTGGNGINHCNTAADLENIGDSFSHGRVMPNINKSTPFYDHNMRGGYTGTVNFNVNP